MDGGDIFAIILLVITGIMVIAFLYGMQSDADRGYNEAVFIRRINRDFNEAVKILGLRKPCENDDFSEKGIAQFRHECKKCAIDVSESRMPNICTYIRVLEMKGMHIEFVKDSEVKYQSVEGNYLGSEAWQNKWERIIFSSSISGSEFCKCVKLIMEAHNFNESCNALSSKESSGRIVTDDSYYIYRALYIMHYNIVIKKDDSILKSYEINNSLELAEIAKPEVVLSVPKDETCYIKSLKTVSNVLYGHDVYARDISTDWKLIGIIYPDNIETQKIKLFTSVWGDGYRYYSKIKNGDIILGKKSPFTMNICTKKEAVIAGNVIGISTKDELIATEYLFLFIKLLCNQYKVNGVYELSEKAFMETNIVIVPPHIQREIIKKGMPVKDDAEQLESVFSSYNEAYPMLRLVSK